MINWFILGVNLKNMIFFAVPAILCLSGCSSSPSCDGSKAQDAVADAAASNDNKLKMGLSFAYGDKYDINSDATFLALDKKMNEDQQKLKSLLEKCGQDTITYAENMKDPSVNYSYDGNEAMYSGQHIDQESICKPVRVSASGEREEVSVDSTAAEAASNFASGIDSSDSGETTTVEGNAAFHKANITPVAYALADDIKKWNDYWNLYHSKQDKSWDEAVKSIAYTLNNIILTAKDHDTGTVQCKATLVGHLDGLDDASTDITYSIEKNSDGDLVATVYGL